MKQRRPRKLAAAVIGVLAVLTASPAPAADVQVIAHPSVPASQISKEELRGIFLETRTSLGSADVEPVLLRSGDVHDTFVKLYMGKTVAGLESYYRSLVFTGRGAMPRRLKSEQEVVAYVRRTRGAIGYVSAAVNTDGVKILDVK